MKCPGAKTVGAWEAGWGVNGNNEKVAMHLIHPTSLSYTPEVAPGKLALHSPKGAAGCAV